MYNVKVTVLIENATFEQIELIKKMKNVCSVIVHDHDYFNVESFERELECI